MYFSLQRFSLCLPLQYTGRQPGDEVPRVYIPKLRPLHHQFGCSTGVSPLNLGSAGPVVIHRLSVWGIWAIVMAVLHLWLFSASTVLLRRAPGIHFVVGDFRTGEHVTRCVLFFVLLFITSSWIFFYFWSYSMDILIKQSLLLLLQHDTCFGTLV